MNFTEFLRNLLPRGDAEDQPLLLYDTLSKKKRLFEPLTRSVAKVYSCGPTVYDYAHIGNLRAYVFADTLRRVLEWNGYRVSHIVNLTDIGHLTEDGDDGEDKMVAALKRLGLSESLQSLYDVGTLYGDAFKEDLSRLNVELPDEFPRPSEHIADQIRLIETLEKKGFIYTTADGVYFDTSKYPDYGKLGGIRTGDQHGARVDVKPEKKSPRDFAVWKFGTLGWESPWGKGFPGWHIECSAMSMRYLGETFDIHTGGIDHIAIHHNNEIAQSEAATGHPLACYWLHSAFMNIGGEKMAKSKQNFSTLRDVMERGYEPMSLRYLYLTAHYRNPLDFSWQSLEAAQTARRRLSQEVTALPDGGTHSKPYTERFTRFINNDLDTPKALALTWDMLKDKKLTPADKKATALHFDRALGIHLAAREKSGGASQGPLSPADLPVELQDLIKIREEARREGNWQKADQLRHEIETFGYSVKDREEKTEIFKR